MSLSSLCVHHQYVSLVSLCILSLSHSADVPNNLLLINLLVFLKYNYRYV